MGSFGTEPMRYVSLSKFEERCLKFFDELENGGDPITVVNKEKPIVIVEPAT